jgi:CubicO group peptidase (beta-lactamase class C family)
MTAQTDSGAVPGLAAYVAHGGESHFVSAGTLALGDSRPTGPDSVWRIASLTKPVAGAATMILVDDGVINLDDPAEKLLPELADRLVLRSVGAALDDTVPASRPITIEDLLTFQFGFGAVMAPPGTYPIQEAEAKLGLMTLGPPWPPPDFGHGEWMARFSTLPLLHQPGEGWMYNTGATIAGALIERAAGVPLADFFQERIFGPLGMVDTGFYWRPDQRDRMTNAYLHDLTLLDGTGDDSMWAQPPALPNAAGWLVSSVADFAAFTAMLVAGGAGIVSAESAAYMTTNHVPDDVRAAAAPFLGATVGWGACMAAPAGTEPAYDIPRGFGWNGGTGTTWTTDPDMGLTGILFTNQAMSSPEPTPVFKDFWAAAYAAVDL